MAPESPGKYPRSFLVSLSRFSGIRITIQLHVNLSPKIALRFLWDLDDHLFQKGLHASWNIQILFQ